MHWTHFSKRRNFEAFKHYRTGCFWTRGYGKLRFNFGQVLYFWYLTFRYRPTFFHTFNYFIAPSIIYFKQTKHNKTSYKRWKSSHKYDLSLKAKCYRLFRVRFRKEKKIGNALSWKYSSPQRSGLERRPMMHCRISPRSLLSQEV